MVRNFFMSIYERFDAWIQTIDPKRPHGAENEQSFHIDSLGNGNIETSSLAEMIARQ